eukprot:GFUD01129854.1.p1 GENE.GFUD01129854.1~~GFUD01129854.1.p1  ORF type:complete len:126 (+),score=28.41 GFUD01129854.1:3-380(+)
MDELDNTTKTVQGMVKEAREDILFAIGTGTGGATELYRSGNLRYYKVPVSFGITMKEGAVPDTCQKFGMMAVCSGPDGCGHNSGRCSVTSEQSVFKPDATSFNTYLQWKQPKAMSTAGGDVFIRE